MKSNMIKVVWLCHFSNSEVHNRLDLHYGYFLKLLNQLAHRSITINVPEFANWVTNGIKEFEKFEDVELHVVSPYPFLKHEIQEFTMNGIYYHFFKNEDDNPVTLIYRQIFKPHFWKYGKNRRRISHLISKIHPDIVHLIGAENPHYSLGLLDVPQSIITIAQLQTLLLDPDVKNNNPHFKLYQYRTEVERQIIKHTNYVGTNVVKFRNIILNEIKTGAIILNTSLALKEPIVKDETEKIFDFVYFASNLSKAADLALEAFGIAFKQNHNITLDIIGYSNPTIKQQLDEVINMYDMRDSVHFEGRLKTHDDVLRQIRKSKIALLPLRSDLISGTIREAMSNGLPVLTTDTGELGTQKLNVDLQCALISKIGDHQALANNMIRLLNDEVLAGTLRQNAYKIRDAARSNEVISRQYVEAYKACLNHKNNGIPIPESLTKT